MRIHYVVSKKRCGVASLLVVVIVGAAALIMAVSASMLGLGDLESGYIAEKGNEALASSEACAEEALRRLRVDNAFSSSSLSFDSGSCTITVSTNGSERTIETVGVVNNYYKHIEVIATVNGRNVSVVSWQEVDT